MKKYNKMMMMIEDGMNMMMRMRMISTMKMKKKKKKKVIMITNHIITKIIHQVQDIIKIVIIMGIIIIILMAQKSLGKKRVVIANIPIKKDHIIIIKIQSIKIRDMIL